MNLAQGYTLLRKIGDSPEEIAAALISLGIRGFQNSVRCCPLAEYLRRNGAAYVETAPLYIMIEYDRAMMTPLACGEFMDRFDEGEWPELLAPPPLEYVI